MLSSALVVYFFLLLRPPPRPTLFPYTTLFRSLGVHGGQVRRQQDQHRIGADEAGRQGFAHGPGDRKSTRLNSSHVRISYAVFCLKKKTPRAFPGSAGQDWLGARPVASNGRSPA